MLTPQKIFIIGIAGSGKTTLAKRLTSQLGYPHIDLDTVRFPKSKDKVLLPELRPIIDELIEEPRWIIEGVYTGWTNSLLAAADKIIWLDTGAKRSATRILLRHALHRLRGTTQHSAGSTLKLAHGVSVSDQPGVRSLNSESDVQPWREEIQAALSPYTKKVVHITSLRQATALNLP
jgi:adenylate kinase family enzyme